MIETMQHLPTFLGFALPEPNSTAAFLLWTVVKIAVAFGVLMTMVAYSVLVERKVSAFIQDRVGPNRVAPPIIGSIPLIGPMLTRWGIWQPLADSQDAFAREGLAFLRSWSRQETPAAAH